MNFVWIDDNPDRKQSAENLAKALGVNCDFIDVKGINVSDPLLELLKKKEPDLILIDQNLIDSVPEEETKGILIRKGSSAATIIRDTWKDCPIICVSGDANGLDSLEKSIYEETYQDHRISDYYGEIHSIASGFSMLRQYRPASVEELLKLLKAPNTEFVRLSAIIPKNIKENFSDAGLIVEISNWTRKLLMSRPGFLLDELWAATYLGLTIRGFNKVRTLFDKALYTGVFSIEDEPLWWKADLLRIISELIPEPGLPNQKARKLESISEEDYCYCSVTKEPYPETVAYVDNTADSPMEPMKYKVTEPHSDFEKILYFEEIRIMIVPE